MHKAYQVITHQLQKEAKITTQTHTVPIIAPPKKT